MASYGRMVTNERSNWSNKISIILSEVREGKKARESNSKIGWAVFMNISCENSLPWNVRPGVIYFTPIRVVKALIKMIEPYNGG